jgi:hypothetical protein
VPRDTTVISILANQIARARWEIQKHRKPAADHFGTKLLSIDNVAFMMPMVGPDCPSAAVA